MDAPESSGVRLRRSAAWHGLRPAWSEPMDSVWPLLKERLSQRPDSEHGQAIVRLVIAVLIVAYLAGLQASDAGSNAGAHKTMLLVMLAEAVVGLGLLVGIVLRPEISHVRRCIGMVADYG